MRRVLLLIVLIAAFVAAGVTLLGPGRPSAPPARPAEMSGEATASPAGEAMASPPRPVPGPSGETRSGATLERPSRSPKPVSVPGGVVRGRVLDRETGEPVPGAVVRVAGRGGRSSRAEEDGSYRLEDLPLGRVSLEVRGIDYMVKYVSLAVPPRGGETIRDFVLVRGAVVRGTVTDAAGTPIPGAMVDAWGGPGRGVKTGPDGGYELRGVPVERTIRVRARHDGYVAGRSGGLRLRSGEKVEGVDLVLREGGKIRGRVLLPDGRPAAGARVMLSPFGRGRTGVMIPAAACDAEGRFDLGPAAPRKYRITARLKGWIAAYRDIEVTAPREDVEGVELTLGASLAIRGTVRDEAGKPLPGIRVTARPERFARGATWGTAVSDAAGRFELKGLRSGTYHLAARPRAGGPAVGLDGVAGGAEEVDLRMPAPGSIAGRLVNGAGRPVPTFSLWILPAGRRRGTGISRQVRSADGTFRVEGVPPGTYTVSASAPGGFAETSTGVEVLPAGTTGGLELVLRPGGALCGHVFESDGRPAVGVRVSVRGGAGAARYSGGLSETGATGEFRVGGLRPGTYRVTAAGAGRYVSRDVVPVESGAEATVELTLPAVGRLVIRVTDEAGSPVAGARVHLRDAGGRWIPVRVSEPGRDVPPEKRIDALREARTRAAVTGADGTCVREGVPEGRVIVRVVAPGFEDGEASATVRGGGGGRVAVTLHPGVSSATQKPGPGASGGGGTR